MEQWEFYIEEGIRSPEDELRIQIVLNQNNMLHEENTSLKSEITELQSENTALKEQLAWFEKQIYGRKSEKTEVVLPAAEQLSLFDEAEQETEISSESVKTTEVKPYTRKAKRTHDEIFAELPVEEVVHTVEEKVCDRCGSEMEVIGREKIRDELVYIPARMYLRRHIAEAVKCTNCGMDESRDAELPDIEKCHVEVAKVPEAMIPYSFCTPELLAHIVYEKYCQAVPLYRQEKDFEGMGVKLSRTTMANWIIMASELWAKPVYEAMKSELLKSRVLHADETTVQVLNEPGKKAKTESRMWVYCGGKENGHSNILFEYQPTRSGKYAREFLGDYSGYLICDGYDGYNKLPGVTRCGCWAHARRKFVNALPKEKEALPTSYAAKGLDYCNRLYLLERKYNGEDEKGNPIREPMSAEERREARQVQSKAVMDEFYAWLDSFTAAGKTNLAKAVQYAKNEKKYLYRFLESGEIPIDNNRAENAVRPFCVGRKNWLFSASVKGAKASAMLYSLIATACANGKKVEEYLTELFRCKPGTVALPW